MKWDKLLSARFLTTLAMCSTYCLINIALVVLVMLGKITTETFLGVFAGFSTMFGIIVKSYFDRVDRKEASKE
jgi:hypothetical protein